MGFLGFLGFFFFALFSFVFQNGRNNSILWTSWNDSVEEEKNEVAGVKGELLEDLA